MVLKKAALTLRPNLNRLLTLALTQEIEHSVTTYIKNLGQGKGKDADFVNGLG